MQLFHLLAAVFVLSGIASALVIAIDQRTCRQPMRIMNSVWVLTGLWASFFGLWAYYAFGRPPRCRERTADDPASDVPGGRSADHAAPLPALNDMHHEETAVIAKQEAQADPMPGMNGMHRGETVRIKRDREANTRQTPHDHTPDGGHEDGLHGMLMPETEMHDMPGTGTHGMRMPDTQTHGMEMHDTTMPDAEMHGTQMSGTGTCGMEMHGMRMPDTTMPDAEMHGTQMSGTPRPGMRMSGTDTRGMEMHGMRMPDTTMPDAEMPGTQRPGTGTRGMERHGMPMPVRPQWQSTVLSTLHCGAGCTLADLVGEWFLYLVPVAIGGSLVAGSWVIDYLLALVFGIGFQYAAIRGMEPATPRSAVLSRAAKADILSLTAWQAGMYGWMALVIFVFRDGQPLPRTSWMFWFMMQIAMACGFLLSLPVNVLLIRRGIKHGM